MSGISAEAVRQAVSRRSDQIIEWARTLIRFPSENRPPDGDEQAAQRFIEAECRQLGCQLDLFAPDEVPAIQEHPGWLAGRRYGAGRRNLVARWPGTGGGQSILLSGHVDVAPSEPDNWTACRPYEPVLKGGRLYGRGSADMKGALAAAFWALRILRELDFKPAGDILFESVVDEEFAGGNGALAARLRGHNADLAVLGEPSRMEVCPACLGAFLGDLTLTGKAGMPFMGAAIPSPIDGAARAIQLFGEWQRKWRDENNHPLFTAPGKELNVLLWHVESAKPGEFVQMGTPLFARLSWIVWCHPGMTEEQFYRRFRAFWEERAGNEPALTPFELTITPTFHHIRPSETPAASAAVQAVAEAYRQCTGAAPSVSGAPFSCDLAVYGKDGGMPSVVLGPRGDNLHAPDEWVEVEDLLTLTGIYATLAANWCGLP